MDVYCATSTTHLDDERFVVAVYERLKERAVRCRLAPEDADDAVQRCAVKLMINLAKLRDRHPTARDAADALWASGPADHLRAERVQRCQGARLKEITDTTNQESGSRDERVVGRPVLPLDSPDAVRSLLKADKRKLVGTAEFERIENLAVLDGILDPLPSRVRRLLWLVYAVGHTVTGAASIESCSREHASRLLADVTAQMRSSSAAA
jgi:DNA-directed RNA polymerase specialized sigma24 family protein